MTTEQIKTFKVFAIAVAALGVAIACAPAEEETSASVCWESGDLIVSNSGSDAVMALKPDGTFRSLVYNVLNTAETVYGLTFLPTTGELLVAVDGTDRVMAISKEDCSSRIAIADPNLTGNLRGISVLSTGDILVVETNNIERFHDNGSRVTTGGWPKALQTAGTDLAAISSGGFVHCSNTTDVVRTYDDTGTQIATRSSGIAGTTDAMACTPLSNGSIAIAWSGTTDTVSFVSSDLTTQSASYTDTNVLGSPKVP